MSYHPNITQTFSTLAKQTISKATSSSNSSKAQPTTATSSASTSNAANETCYLVISPNPNSGWYTSDLTVRVTSWTDLAPSSFLPQQPGKARYHIKIGDGNFRDAYFVSNPSFEYASLSPVLFHHVEIHHSQMAQLQRKHHRTNSHDKQRASGKISRTEAFPCGVGEA